MKPSEMEKRGLIDEPLIHHTGQYLSRPKNGAVVWELTETYPKDHNFEILDQSHIIKLSHGLFYNSRNACERAERLRKMSVEYRFMAALAMREMQDAGQTADVMYVHHALFMNGISTVKVDNLTFNDHGDQNVWAVRFPSLESADKAIGRFGKDGIRDMIRDGWI